MTTPTTTTIPSRELLLKRIEELRAIGCAEQAEKIKKDYHHILFPEVSPQTQYWLDKYITQDSDMLHLKKCIAKLAKHSDTVLLEGPTGTGKEILARALHGDRTDKFIGINCAAVQETLIESELFGHVKGAFTGAHENTLGLFREAGRGTIFLDEVGELPLTIQSKLLRVLQERVVRPVGGTLDKPVHCRIVCATHRDLRSMVDERPSRFREDLFYRLNTFHLKITPLVERPSDIPLITDYWATWYENENKIVEADKKFPRNHKIDVKGLEGNVRSIQQIIRRYHVLGEL